MKTRKPVRAAAMLAIAFAFKLQTIFFFPIVLLGLIHGEYKPKHALVFALAYLATTVPALIAGRSLGTRWAFMSISPSAVLRQADL